MRYGLIGAKLAQSYSATIHNMLGNRAYELKELPARELERFLAAHEFAGINVTMPYKRSVIEHCLPSGMAREIGVVNTIVNGNGVLYGYNTDYDGFLYMADRAGVDFSGKKVMVLGSGGTSQTVCRAAAARMAGEIVVISRKGADNYENISKHYDSEIIVNTTPAGMFPDNGGMPIDIVPFTRLSAVLDAVYNPLKTLLVLAAENSGIKSSGGLPMLAAQAVHAHKLFFDLRTDSGDDAGIIEGIISKIMRMHRNIVFIGMPGCGKTTIGREIARRLNISFVDTDTLAEREEGHKIPEIIKENGEEYFRKLESAAIAEAAKKSGTVIATGGGSILAEANCRALKQNGYIIYLDRSIDALVTEGRPLSLGAGSLSQLYEVRAPLYNSVCDVKIQMTDNLNENIARILEHIG